MLTSCVSSKKYKASQASLQQVRNDSAQLAQQVSSLNQNVASMEEKNKSLQTSLDKSTGMYTTQSKTLGYYQDYMTEQQTTITQVSQELKDALTQAGVSDQNIVQMNGNIYVTLDETTAFKKNTSTMTTDGSKVLTSLADVIKKHDDVVVRIDDGVTPAATDETTTTMATTTTSSSGNSSFTGNGTKKVKKTSMASSTSGTSSGTTASSSTAVAKKRAPRKYSTESNSLTFSTKGVSKKSSKAWAMKTGRVNAVAKGLLKNGVKKVHVSAQPIPANYSADGNNTIKVIVTPKVKDFTAPAGSTVSTTGTNQ
jgi:outer membrane protein OmpA-like peptidoglycan-associated protein